jgi:energy-coupling factor transporter ATP-binding protein EcfA2
MAYQVIARKWRPQRFDDVVGQQAVTRTLRNALASGRLAQAFVFAGPRGVGKTTTARILARALNCEKGPTGDPCGICDACVEIAEGRDIDVLEIDAATHTGVDNVREVIIAGLGIMPVRNRYKVFIIDEVHMLSASSFNALLKSIEEPPPHVIFMMATTELHKIPDTVLSRAQVHEFRTISAKTVADRLRFIADLLPEIAAKPLILLVDQFEETYSLCDDAAECDAGGGARPAGRGLPAAADAGLTFAPEAVPNLNQGTWDWAGAISLGSTGAPTVAVANGNEVRLSSGATFAFPGGPAATRPETDGILGVDFSYDFKTDLVFATAEQVARSYRVVNRLRSQGSPSMPSISQRCVLRWLSIWVSM